jgi:hypothetical protein
MQKLSLFSRPITLFLQKNIYRNPSVLFFLSPRTHNITTSQSFLFFEFSFSFCKVKQAIHGGRSVVGNSKKFHHRIIFSGFFPFFSTLFFHGSSFFSAPNHPSPHYSELPPSAAVPGLAARQDPPAVDCRSRPLRLSVCR